MIYETRLTTEVRALRLDIINTRIKINVLNSRLKFVDLDSRNTLSHRLQVRTQRLESLTTFNTYEGIISYNL